jgi:hypothetical protein
MPTAEQRTRTRGPLMLAVAALVALLGGCGAAPKGVPIQGRVLTVACAHCIFHMPNVKSCPWAAELDGHYYLLTGNVPSQQNSHAPGGICTMKRQARIDGELVNDVIRVARLELLPIEPGSVPAPQQLSQNHLR